MTEKEKAHVASYSITKFRATPLLVALERCSKPDIKNTHSWDILVPGIDEPLRTTKDEELADQFRQVGAVTVRHEHEEKTVKETSYIIKEPWEEDLKELRDQMWEEHEGPFPGRIKAWGFEVEIETPAKLPIQEHIKRRERYQEVLDRWNLLLSPLYEGGWDPRPTTDWKGDPKTYHGEFSLAGCFTKVHWNRYSGKLTYKDWSTPENQAATYSVECSTRHSSNVCQRVVSSVKANQGAEKALEEEGEKGTIEEVAA